MNNHPTTTENGVDVAISRRPEQVYLERERIHKIELAVVCAVWLVGCPLLALRSQPSTTMYAQGDDRMCGVIALSISASMTGFYPKLFGSLVATLFAVLVVQRNTNGLVALLKLGWLHRFSPVLFNNTQINDKTNSTTPTATILDEKHRQLALQVWKRLRWIEALGHWSGACLISLVAFDAKFFPATHNIVSTMAFGALLLQNYYIGRLGVDFPSVFPNWSHLEANRYFWLALLHITIMGAGMFFVLGPLEHFHQCGVIDGILERVAAILHVDHSTVLWMVSIAFWYNEYAFAILCVAIQLYDHWQIQLWNFVGGYQNMPVTLILSRFSVTMAIRQTLFGGRDEEILLLLQPTTIRVQEEDDEKKTIKKE